ncbi:serine hydrolase domain-containing protein [Isoptericola halotolerans]|uniref:CubicO group peptidase (Beta-lactamase class C family) n=1 Tax=Isoptericola halotolerans TaxID=300560 RepID=A0ABX2A3R2_9MICO|nr:serine hydrolase domain-containing protein [Isoptericola halotolerans]NOV97326.1 CubicO group peptidase (beta-lactamase class C family) [Isoptericola halotolerans]
MTVGAPERARARSTPDLNTSYLADWVTTRAALARVPGVQYAVLVGDEVVLDGAWGVTDLTSGTPLRPDHLFRVASHSKTFTATAVARLVERGQMRLDDRLGTFVPEIGRAPVGEVTVREALGHTGGVRRDGRDADFWQLGAPFPDRARLLDEVLSGGDVLGRGEAFKYSNLAYGLLGLAIEAVTGVSYAEHVSTDLLEPLGLADTYPELDEGLERRAVVGHSAPTLAEPGLPVRFADGRLPVAAVTTGALAAATGFCSTARDLVRWAAAHGEGSDLLEPQTRRLLQRAESVVDRPGAPRREYGLGFEVREIGGRRVVGHSGGFPGQITRTWCDPARRVAVAVLTNAVDGPADQIASGLFSLVSRSLPDDGGTAAGAGGTVTQGSLSGDTHPLDRWTGRFANLWGMVDVVRLGGRLWSIDPRQADPFVGAEELTVDGAALRPEVHDGFGPVGEPIEVLRDAADEPVAVVVGGMTSWRAADYERERRAQAGQLSR